MSLNLVFNIINCQQNNFFLKESLKKIFDSKIRNTNLL